MTEPLRVLHVEDSSSDAKLVLGALRRIGRPLTSTRVQDAEDMRAALATEAFDLVVSDWSMPRFSGRGALDVLHDSGLDLPFIIVSGTIGEGNAVDAMRAGAHDYVLKDDLARLVPAVERELRDCDGRAERRRAEQALVDVEAQLRQAQKMEAVGRLAGGVAHDFNNLLTVIMAHVEFALDDLPKTEPVRDGLSEVYKAARRAAELTRQLLQFSRQQLMEPQVLDINDVVGGMEKMLRRVLGEDVRLTWLPGIIRRGVRADRGSLEQVFMNLVVNARDAMPTGGKLTIETTEVVLDEAFAATHVGVRPGPHVTVAVTDTGTGMDKATQARIFEPFFTTKAVGKGTGLGLSTAFGIIQVSGGAIWVYSEPGLGTTFNVYLPLVDAPFTADLPAPAPENLRGSEAILLVEDEDQVRVVVRDVLTRYGYRVTEARNAGEALLSCEREPGAFALLLTDVVMPQMSGPELATRLAATRPDMKLLCMSGYTDDSAVRHGVLESGIPYIQKPITGESLARKVREVLGG